MDEMFQLTIWDDPAAPVKTAAGGITFGKWIAEQAAGLASAGIRTEIRKRDSDHFLALFRSRGHLTRGIRCLKENITGHLRPDSGRDVK